MTLGFLLMAGIFFLPSAPARADVTASGTFTAKSACPAVQSIKKGTNPGNVMLTPGTGYSIISANRTPPTHYLLLVPGASPDHRWAAIDCGTLDGSGPTAAGSSSGTLSSGTSSSDTGPPTGTAGGNPHSDPVPTTNDTYVLAVSWEPGFCSDHTQAIECNPEAASDATHFVLHGLWRDPYPSPYAYCTPTGDKYKNTDLGHHWNQLPAVTLTPSAKAHLDASMPGTQSLLERHEWIVHGTCAGVSMDAFFERTADLLEAVNASPIRAFIVNHIGQRVTLQDVQAQFDQAFGGGTGKNVVLDCEGRFLSEIHIGLRGDVIGDGKLADLVANGYRPAEDSHNCAGGTVRSVGAR